jgi:large subunit ribosomal protein L33
MGVKSKRKIALACTQCQERNYHTEKNATNTPERLSGNKFCPKCKAHTLHQETK